MTAADNTGALELTILMPCLNEAETLATCIRKARGYLERSGVAGEVLIADNGSTDGSQAIAEAEGARVVPVPRKGYGAALIGGIAAARGRFVIMGDADDSYDFSSLQPFVDGLRAGADIVMGNRFRGGIAPGAMPVLHKYLGNPVLSFLGRLFFGLKAKDFHCGLRGFDRERMMALGCRTEGMEFASEMLVRASFAGYRIEEVPTTLKPDGRSRPPHLRTWRDGWRHLRFLLIHTPQWLFLYPGALFLALGLVGVALLSGGQVRVGGVGLSIHTFLVLCQFVVIGVQLMAFAVMSQLYASHTGLFPVSDKRRAQLSLFSLENMLIAGGALLLAGFGGSLYCVWLWAGKGFGDLQYASLARVLMLSLTGLVVGVQLVFTAFLSAIITASGGAQR